MEQVGTKKEPEESYTLVGVNSSFCFYNIQINCSINFSLHSHANLSKNGQILVLIACQSQRKEREAIVALTMSSSAVGSLLPPGRERPSIIIYEVTHVLNLLDLCRRASVFILEERAKKVLLANPVSWTNDGLQQHRTEHASSFGRNEERLQR